MFEVYKNAANLPQIWDEIAGDNIFLKKDVLRKLEETNPCKQLYHLNQEKKLVLVSYELKINLFTFTNSLSLRIPSNIIGVPMSVAKSGYSICKQNSQDSFREDKLREGTLREGTLREDTFGEEILSEYIKSLKGFYLVLNAVDHLNLAKGNTLPTCRLSIKWKSLEEYLEDMRSHYRYRLKRAIKKFSGVRVEELEDNSYFNEEMYKLYLNVYERSSEKLEKLDITFFQNFPAKILKFTLKGTVVAFVQLVETEKELFFLFGGFEHSLNQQHDLYINMLLQIIEYGLKKGVKKIDFGQTAEETKLKLGASQEPKYLYVHHSNPIINALLGKLVNKFSYRRYEVLHKVFREIKGDKDESPTSKMP